MNLKKLTLFFFINLLFISSCNFVNKNSNIDSFSQSSNTSSNIDTSNTSSFLSSFEEDDNEYTNDEYFNFINLGRGYALSIKKIPSSNKVIIPSYYNSLPIIALSDNAFKDCSTLTKIILPDSIEYIGDNAFYNCSSLQTLILPNNLKYLSSEVFTSCSNLIYHEFDNCLYLGSLINPYLVLVSYKDKEVKNINVHKDCSLIYEKAFSDYLKLESISLSDNLIYIGDLAFNNTPSLKYNEFNSCSYLGSKNNPYLCLINADKLVNETDLAYDLKIIYYQAFNENKLIKHLNFEQIVFIGGSSFANSSLESISLSNNLLTLSSYAFENCTFLTDVILSNQLLSIEYGIFSNCTSLINVNIPNNVLYVKNSSFSNCENLNFYEYENCYYLGNEENKNLLLIKANKDIVTCHTLKYTRFIYEEAFSDCYELNSFYLNEEVVSILDSCFMNCSLLESVILNDNIDAISYNLFSNCSSLTNITLGKNIKIIEEYAFENCTSLNNFNLNEGLNIISSHAFYNSCLNDIVIPSSLKELQGYAFYNCSSLQSVKFNNNQSLSSIGKFCFANCSNLKTVEFDEETNLTSLEESCFSNCTSLTKLIIPHSIIQIGSKIIENCTSLNFNEFGNCYYLGDEINQYLLLIKAKDKSVNEVLINEKTKFIYEKAFYNCQNVIDFIIPKGVMELQESCFEGMKNLLHVVIEDDSSLLRVGIYAFKDCLKLQDINLPDSITYFGSGTFYNCQNLISIILPNNITSISYMMFYNCLALEDVIVPSTISYVGHNAFYHCDKLKNNEYSYCYYLGNKLNPHVILLKAKYTLVTNVTIDKETKVLCDEAFYDCWSLTSIFIPKSVIYVGNYAFTGCSSLTIYCEVESKPSTWGAMWNSDNLEVIWNYKENLS